MSEEPPRGLTTTCPTPHRPALVAHRANATGPSRAENTVEAIVLAAAAGADAVELDVRRTVDGQVVLGHDPIQWRRHHGVAVPRVVRWTRRQALAFLDGVDEALECAAGLGLGVKLDVKDASAVPVVRDRCRAHRIEPARLALWCRSPARIVEPVNHDVFGEVALLATRQTAEGYLRDAVRVQATAVSLDPPLISAGSVSAAHERGLTVYAWIVDEHRRTAAVDLGVDGLVTDWIDPAGRRR